MEPRTIAWFSCGVTSAVACKLAIADHPHCEVVRIALGGEHPDNDRFHADCERWFGREIKTLLPSPYLDHLEVAEKTRFIKNAHGYAKCTEYLKIRTRVEYQRHGDIHVYGFDADEVERAEKFRDKNPTVETLTPLIDAGLTKGDCKAIVERAGIELPVMYKLGYANNNCIGCWKGGMGYWNRIRRDFPDVFARAAKVCREIGRSPVKEADGTPIQLDELDPNRGRFAADEPVSCGPLCELTIRQLEPKEEVISC